MKHTRGPDSRYREALLRRWQKIAATVEDVPEERRAERWSELRQAFYKKYGNIPLSTSDHEKLANLRGQYSGERIFIIGNGPSLNKTPLEKLENEFTFAVNRFYLLFDQLAWRPTFYTALDWRVVPDIYQEINALRGSLFFFEERFRGLLREGDDVVFYTHSPATSSDPINRGFSSDLTRGARGAGSVIGSAIQIACHLGFEEIHLLGCDLGYQVLPSVSQSGEDVFGTGVKIHLESTLDDDPNHFDSRYFGAGRKWHDPNVPRMIAGHEQCQEGVNALGRSIFNSGIGGELEVYERKDIMAVLETSGGIAPLRRSYRIDEIQILYRILVSKLNRDGVMIDVGAHHGSSSQHFAEIGWQIHCFEPDDENRKTLEKRFGKNPAVRINPQAVGEKTQDSLLFYSSSKSSGISSLHKFHESHAYSQKVDLISLSDYCAKERIDRVDFLKIDAEGHDLSVLNGFPWHQLKPEVVICEFEDRKTLPRGKTWQDLAEFLLSRGYFVYISEWWPIKEYGLKHDWRGLYEYRPDLRLGPNAWGNLLAFRQDPGLITLLAMSEETKAPNETLGRRTGSSNKNYLSSVAIAVDLATRKWPKLHRVLSSGYRGLQRFGNPK